jgi:hypothetical protein
VSHDSRSAKKPPEGAPSWLEWIQRWERSIGEPVEQFVRSDTYFDLMTQMKRARAQVTRKAEDAWEEWLHLFNMPAATDIRRLREQLSRLERQVNRIAKDLEDREEDAQEPPARPAAKPKPKPRSPRPAKPKSSGSGEA